MSRLAKPPADAISSSSIQVNMARGDIMCPPQQLMCMCEQEEGAGACSLLPGHQCLQQYGIGTVLHGETLRHAKASPAVPGIASGMEMPPAELCQVAARLSQTHHIRRHMRLAPAVQAVEWLSGRTRFNMLPAWSAPSEEPQLPADLLDTHLQVCMQVLLATGNAAHHHIIPQQSSPTCPSCQSSNARPSPRTAV